MPCNRAPVINAPVPHHGDQSGQDEQHEKEQPQKDRPMSGMGCSLDDMVSVKVKTGQGQEETEKQHPK